MKEWELTEEEVSMAKALGEADYNDLVGAEGRFYDEEELSGQYAIAKAAQKKLVEWLETKTNSYDAVGGIRVIKLYEWRALKAALEVRHEWLADT